MNDNEMSHHLIKTQVVRLLKSGEIEKRGKVSPSGVINCRIYAIPGSPPRLARQRNPITYQKGNDVIEDDPETIAWMREIQDRKHAKQANMMRGRV